MNAHITTVVPRDFKEHLQRQADRQGITVAQLVRDALGFYKWARRNGYEQYRHYTSQGR